MNLTSFLSSISTLLITESKFVPVLKLKYFGFFTGGPVTAIVLSGKYSPDQWARVAVENYYKYEADKIIAEVNNGGDLVEKVVRTIDMNVSYRSVRATKGKYLRAEPVSALYEQKRVKHEKPLPFLEDQMCNYNPVSFSGSPDRLDALVWALTDLSASTGQAYWRIS